MAEGEEHMVENINENAKNPKKKQHSTVLDNFSKLIKEDAKIRVKSGATLIKHFTLNAKNANDANEEKYFLGRLIRGLGAAKNSSRAGFYSTLTIFLQNNDCKVDAVFELIEKELHTSGNYSKSENADILTGNILICGALLRSQQFAKASKENQTKIVELLISAGKKKSYLNLLSYSFLVDALDNVQDSDFQKCILPVIKPEITKSLGDLNLDNVYFLIKAQEKFPKIFKHAFMKEMIGYEEIISTHSLENLVEVLMNVLPIKQLLYHPVYEIVCKKIATSQLIPQFLTELENSLNNHSSMMRQHVAVIMLTHLTQNLVDTNHLPELFGKKFLQLTLSHFKTVNCKNQDELQLDTYKFFDAIVARLKDDTVKTKTKLAVLKRLLFFPGTFIFEKLTRSKVVQQITASLNTEGVKKLCKVYQQVLLAEKERQRNESTHETWVNLDRVYASQLIVKLINHPSMKNENGWKIEQLKVLMVSALVKQDNIGAELATSLRETFFRALDLRLIKLDDLREILTQLVHDLNAQITQDNYAAIMRNAFTQEEYELWISAVVMIDKLEKKVKKSRLNPVFHTLFLQMALQLFNDVKLARDSLQELFACYERRKSVKHDEQGDEIHWIEVVVDLFLNLLSHNSHLLRNLVNCVFPHLCKDLTATAIHQILSVLDPKSDSSPLSEDTDSSDSSDDDNDDESDDDDDKEESDEDESVVSDNEETVNDKLRQAVRQALTEDAALTDQESVDLDAMSDGECEKLNSALGDAFKKFKPNTGKKSRKQNKADETLTHFRIRVLDLIETFLDSDASMILSLEIMLPLLQALEFSIRDHHQKPLQDRIKHCLKKLCNIKNFTSLDEVSEDILCDLVKSLLEKGTKNAIIIAEMGEKMSDCCVFIIRCMQQLCGSAEATPKKQKKKLKKITAILLDELETFFKKRDCLTPYVLFKKILSMSWEGNVTLIPLLITFVFNVEIRPFRRSQALELLKIFYSNNRLLSAHADVFRAQLENLEQDFYVKTITTLQGVKTNVKDKFICGLFNLLSTIKNSPVKTEAINWNEIAEVVKEFRSEVILSKDAKIAYKKLCKALKIANTVVMKSKTFKLSTVNDEDAHSQNSDKKERKNKKKSNDRQKLRKETQILRMQSLSEGLGESFAFTKTDVETLEVEENKMNEENMDVDETSDDEATNEGGGGDETSGEEDELSDGVEMNGNETSDDEEIVKTNGLLINGKSKRKKNLSAFTPKKKSKKK